jgi:uncharacterized phosphosugar-binding protein
MLTYIDKILGVVQTIGRTQTPVIQQAADAMAASIAGGRAVYLFGSGHSILPIMDIFPRYGSFAGFVPIIDPRLLWHGATGPGGARELLWIERREGYIEHLMRSFHVTSADTMWVFSHGGLNAAPVEMALYAKTRGATVVAVTSVANQRLAIATHSSGRKLGDVADIVIDNCVPPEDAVVAVDGWAHPVAAASTASVVIVTMTVVAEVARRLASRGLTPPVFVSPNVNPDAGHNDRVFQAHMELLRRL